MVIFMESGENKRTHLKLIQDVIKRMAGNSFLLKGWSITLVVAIVSVSVGVDVELIQGRTTRFYLLLISLFLVVVFWLLDAYYLSQERAYRDLYNEVRIKEPDKIDFTMNAKKYKKGSNSWFSSMFSYVFLVFYGSAAFLLLLLVGDMINVNMHLK